VAITPPGDPMFGYAEVEVVIHLHGHGPWGIEYLNPEDDPRGGEGLGEGPVHQTVGSMFAFRRKRFVGS